MFKSSPNTWILWIVADKSMIFFSNLFSTFLTSSDSSRSYKTVNMTTWSICFNNVFTCKLSLSKLAW